MTRKQIKFIELYEKRYFLEEDFQLGKIVYMIDKETDIGYEKLERKIQGNYDAKARQMRNRLIKNGKLTIESKRVKTLKGKLNNLIKEEQNKMSYKEHLLNKFKNLKDNKDKELINIDLFETFEELLKKGKIKLLETKDMQIKCLTALVHYGTSIEEYKDGNNNIRRKMRHPNISIQAMRLITELTGTIKQDNNVNIQINNILQEIEAKRISELIAF